MVAALSGRWKTDSAEDLGASSPPPSRRVEATAAPRSPPTLGWSGPRQAAAAAIHFVNPLSFVPPASSASPATAAKSGLSVRRGLKEAQVMRPWLRCETCAWKSCNVAQLLCGI